MSDLIASFASNPYIPFAAVFSSMVCLASSIILYYRSKREKKPRLVISSLNLFNENSKKINGLETMYMGRTVQNVTITRITLWNSGRETIQRNDISPADPLTISINPKFRILESQVLSTKKVTNVIKLEETEAGLKTNITFDYLDYGGGAVIQVVHTGNSSADIKVEGTIVGYGKLKARNKQPESAKPLGNTVLPKKFKRLSTYMFYLYTMFILIIVWMHPDVLAHGGSLFFGKVIVCATINLALLYLWLSRGRKKAPQDFQVFEENFS